MPWGLKRFHESGQTHFVTFSCYRCRSLFAAATMKRIFEAALERVRRSFGLCDYGYVVMPEHVHLPISEPQWNYPTQANRELEWATRPWNRLMRKSGSTTSSAVGNQEISIS